MARANRLPTVLCLSGHDPTGGAGIQADIETVRALGGHAATVITAYTAQDTHNVRKVLAPTPAFLSAQLAALLADVRVDAVKIGLLGEAKLVPTIAKAIGSLGVPVVLDPVLRAGGGRNLANVRLLEAMRRRLLPMVTVVTPNRAELLRLAARRSDAEAARALLDHGAGNVLVTGGDGEGDSVVNRWYRAKGHPRCFAWKRIPGAFHGAGCTLAAAIATLLARGYRVAEALHDAQVYTHTALQSALAQGRGRRIPDRAP